MSTFRTIPLLTAARALLDAMGGNPPDWLAKEAADLERALNVLYTPEWPHGVQNVEVLRFEKPVGADFDEWRRNVQKTDLYQRGDTVLVWVNEGDLYCPGPMTIPGGRLESGPVRFGDDWTGLFLRGDSCFAYALALKALKADKTDAFARAAIDGLITALESTNEQKA